MQLTSERIDLCHVRKGVESRCNSLRGCCTRVV